MSDTTNAQDIIDQAYAAAKPNELDDNLYGIVLPKGAEFHIEDLRDHGDLPRRKTGTVKTADADSFVAYVRKHELPQSEVWADLVGTKVVAVINAHGESVPDDVDPGDAGWRDHRATLTVRKTDAWNAWTALDRKYLSQQDFAEHIEDRAIDIVSPSGADMLELAQSITGTIGVNFESSKRLSNGEARFEYKEAIDAKAGQRGQLEIPTTIELALVPFEGAPGYKVKARFRYRIDHGRLLLSYALERPDDVLREAFLDVVTLIEGDLERKVYRGTPE